MGGGGGGGSAGGVKGEGRREDAKCDGRVTDGAERHGQMLWLGRRGGEVILKAEELPSLKQGAKRKRDVTVETGG